MILAIEKKKTLRYWLENKTNKNVNKKKHQKQKILKSKKKKTKLTKARCGID